MLQRFAMNFRAEPFVSSASILGRNGSSLLLPGPFGRPSGRPETFRALSASFGSGRKRVVLDLGGHRERHDNDPALDRFVEPPESLDGVDPDAGVRGDGQDFHAFEHQASEPGKLADDQNVTFAQFLQNVRDPSLAPRDPAGSLLLNELDPAEVLLAGSSEDVCPVPVQVLPLPGHPETSNGPGLSFGSHRSRFE